VTARTGIDELYASFVSTLPAELQPAARALPSLLHLAPSPDIPWSEVFSHEVTLGAPRLVAEGMAGLPEEAIRDAQLAHLLAIIEAFGTDRLLDGQVDPSRELDGILDRARIARDAALARVLALAPPSEAGDADLTYQRADEETVAAIRAEHDVLRSGEAVPWSRYLSVAHGKQRLGLPASLALARLAGWDARRRRTLALLLDAVWVGLQLHDDVIDWEGDLARGGAWAASLAAHAPFRSDPRDRKTVPVSARRLVFESGALLRMLRHSARCFRAARRRAAALGLERFGAWARDRERTLDDLARKEAASPGQTNRAHALSSWAKTVLQG
jgi:hypothetical protein